jgi:hypothetical protein
MSRKGRKKIAQAVKTISHIVVKCCRIKGKWKFTGIKKSLLPTFNAPTTFNDRQIHPITAQPVTYLKALVPIQLP